MLTQYDSPLGPITLTFDGEFLTGLRFGEPAEGCVSPLATDHQPLTTSLCWLDIYFSGRQPDFTPKIFLQGTPFQKFVWLKLCEVPFGQTVSYGELSCRVGCRSAQAVGQAVGKNPIALIIPCHRVIGSNGSLTGYAYGLDRKQYLLQLEKQHNSI